MTAKLDYTFAADALAQMTGVNASVLSALINAESAWNPNAVSPTGATGLGQFTTATATMYGLMGSGFDNRRDAALNLTAAAKYLAALRTDNPTWRAVIGHYSGQGPALSGYAGYSAGQALIATIDAADGVPIPPVSPVPPPIPLPPDPSAQTIVVTATDSIGRTGSATIPLVRNAMMAVLGIGAVSAAVMFAPKSQEAADAAVPIEASAPQRDLAASLAPLYSTNATDEWQTSSARIPDRPITMQARELMEMWWLSEHPAGTTVCGPRKKDMRWLLNSSPCITSSSGR